MVIDPSLLFLGKIALGLLTVYLAVLITPSLLVVGGVLLTFLLFVSCVLLAGVVCGGAFIIDLLRATWVSIKNLYKRITNKEIN